MNYHIAGMFVLYSSSLEKSKEEGESSGSGYVINTSDDMYLQCK